MKKAINCDIDDTWMEWALEMMQAGYDFDNLYILSGIAEPYNQFELQDLTDKVLLDLSLDYKDKPLTIRNYVYYMISKTINDLNSYLMTLREIKDICIDLDMDKEYMDFYLLYFAKDDLNDLENQYYWDGADRTNIDTIIKDSFRSYLDKIDETIKTKT